MADAQSGSAVASAHSQWVHVNTESGQHQTGSSNSHHTVSDFFVDSHKEERLQFLYISSKRGLGITVILYADANDMPQNGLQNTNSTAFYRNLVSCAEARIALPMGRGAPGVTGLW